MDVRTAIVTGAASGLGALDVTRMRVRGVRVIAADRNPAIHQRPPDDRPAQPSILLTPDDHSGEAGTSLNPP